MAFKLKNASVHYGTSTYPLNGLPARFNEVESVEALDLNDLKLTVGHLTSFARDFTAKHIARQEFPGIIDKRTGADMVIPEQIYASANGYSLTWERV